MATKTPLKPRHCRECGETFEPKTRTATFCCEAHRLAFNNRRLQRGAQLYDTLMEARFNREAPDANELRTLVTTLAAFFREEDTTERQGRKSWQNPREGLLPVKSWRTRVQTRVGF